MIKGEDVQPGRDKAGVRGGVGNEQEGGWAVPGHPVAYPPAAASLVKGSSPRELGSPLQSPGGPDPAHT